MATTTDSIPVHSVTGTMTDERRNGKQRWTAMLAAARDEYVSEASRGRAGRAVVARYADRLDLLIGDLVAQARGETSVAVAVCAVGGYGRRALCLHSDLDLLIVFNGVIGPPEERFVKAVLQPLWDLRLEIGQHVRELSELDDIDLGNPEFLLSLLDVRPLAGDSDLLDVILAHAG
ncbi:MAG TPA: hypothetical protein VK595_02660, partial [Vicinamibacterales bacterium]|nr:hypothetical protein [Vicinamibacterales bacterium]